MAWSEWFDRLGLQQPMGLQSLQFSQYDHAIGAAVHGCGIAIGRTPSVLSSLASGQLQLVLPEHRIAGLHYYLLFSEHSADKPSVRQVASWLEAELQAQAHCDALPNAAHQPDAWLSAASRTSQFTKLLEAGLSSPDSETSA
jgi:LysR family transcriptional regulator, glycine cleavage system transcriptional activator